MSIPLAKTRRAASGSPQMLNSAAGVRFPSPTAPPMSTIRSGRASGASASSSAMFVSGPVGTSVTAPCRSRIVCARNQTACCSSGRPCAGGNSGPSRPLSPCTCAATEGSRTSGRSAPAATGHLGAAGELEHAQRVRGRLGERLVAGDRGHPEQLELGGGEREQDRDRVVVPGVAVEDDRRRRHSHASSSSAVGSELCAPKLEAA